MINLRGIYGNKIFDRKTSYKSARYIPYIAIILLDLLLALVIVYIFAIEWDYAFIKVYLILLLFEVLKYIYTSIIDTINYRLTVKDAMSKEMNHYLTVFNSNVNWDEISTYDDFLLERAFNETQPTDLRVLAAINYGVLADTIRLIPKYENRFYRLFCEIAPKYISNKCEMT
jgi:hypothetical protein